MKHQSKHLDTRTKTDRNVLGDKNTSVVCTEKENLSGKWKNFHWIFQPSVSVSFSFSLRRSVEVVISLLSQASIKLSSEA